MQKYKIEEFAVKSKLCHEVNGKIDAWYAPPDRVINYTGFVIDYILDELQGEYELLKGGGHIQDAKVIHSAMRIIIDLMEAD